MHPNGRQDTMATIDYTEPTYRVELWDFSADNPPTLVRALNEQEYEELRQKAIKLHEEKKTIIRSCGLRNQAHYHLHDDEDYIMYCFSCHRRWVGKFTY